MPEESPEKLKKSEISDIYPLLKFDRIHDPKRIYAFPLLGFIYKILILIPIYIELMFVGIWLFILLVINAFVVMAKGKYYAPAYNIALGYMRLSTKADMFLNGLTDKYPGFELQTNGIMELTVAKPEDPKRWFAFPLLGFISRTILLIPYYIFSTVMQRANWLALVFASFPVLFSGKFPESLYEFEKDTLRVSLSSTCYFAGLSDEYPSFRISMNHKNIKIALLIAGSILVLLGLISNFSENSSRRSTNYQYNYHYSQPPSTNSTY